LRYLYFPEEALCNLMNVALTKLVINRLPATIIRESRFPTFIATLADGMTGLDLGCGVGSHLPFDALNWYGLDIHMPSLLSANTRPDYHGFICADLVHVDRVLQPKCVDTIVAFDLIEHFRKPESAELLINMEALARRSVAEMRGLGYNVIGWSGWRGFAGPRAYIWRRLRALFLILSLISQPIVEQQPQIAFHLLCWKDVAAQAS
jgi:methyltransferase family protein